jgi:hypothetical protein
MTFLARGVKGGEPVGAVAAGPIASRTLSFPPRCAERHVRSLARDKVLPGRRTWQTEAHNWVWRSCARLHTILSWTRVAGTQVASAVLPISTTPTGHRPQMN